MHGCDLVVDHTGSGAVEFGVLTACSLDLNQTGSGRTLIADGGVDDLKMVLSGSGGFKNPDFEADVADLTLTGSAGAELTVNDAIRARLSGSGGIAVHGNPEGRDVQASGSGRVNFE
jgi:hypothetical protein